jgi:hypothetical protein
MTTKTIATLATLIIVVTFSSHCMAGQFYGELSLDLNPSDASGETRLLHENFGFEDSKGLRWQANKGDLTNGASIPPLLQPIVGDPFDKLFIRGAVIHDRYCDKDHLHNVRPWRDTHRMFYDALLTAGVPKLKAKIMYYAVYTFGPRWDKLSKGVPCGRNCINATPDYNDFYRPDSYAAPASAAELTEATSKIESMSDSRHPNDEFLLYSVTQ